MRESIQKRHFQNKAIPNQNQNQNQRRAILLALLHLRRIAQPQHPRPLSSLIASTTINMSDQVRTAHRESLSRQVSVDTSIMMAGWAFIRARPPRCVRLIIALPPSILPVCLAKMLNSLCNFCFPYVVSPTFSAPMTSAAPHHTPISSA